MPPVLPLAALYLASPINPREYVEFEGVLLPVDGPHVAFQCAALTLVLTYMLAVSAFRRPHGKVCSGTGRVHRLFADAGDGSWAQWN